MSTFRRIADIEVPAALALLTNAGGTARTLDSWKHDRMTALALGDPGSLLAVMPLAHREIRIGSARTLAAGWLSSNQFATRMSWRRQTRDTAAQWSTHLPELDALIVMRRDESSSAARWYAQTGFADILSIRCLYLDMDAPPAAPAGAAQANSGRYHVKVVSPADWDAAAWQTQMAAVYADVYANAAGPVTRHAEFWQNALAHHYYKEHYQFQIIGLWNTAQSRDANSEQLMGYAVVGWSGWHSKRPRMDILELATRQWDTAVAADLIATTCQLAWSKNVRQVRAVISAHDPYRGHLARMGFVDRWGYVLQAKWLNPQRYLDRLGTSLPKELGDFWLQLNAPGHVPLTLGRGARSAPAPSLHLQADAATLTRLLLNRTDMTAALQEGSLLPATPLSDADMARLSHCFPWTPWVFHMLDY
ncbi:MAG TPA: hypothetical protein VHM90_22680, partial [Phycisphaerae bacterium]|nr:hypothetical protein [Phycisphaerae bacterium]